MTSGPPDTYQTPAYILWVWLAIGALTTGVSVFDAKWISAILGGSLTAAAGYLILRRERQDLDDHDDDTDDDDTDDGKTVYA